MFTTVELGRKMSKADYAAAVPTLREELLEIQQQLRQADFPVIVTFGGPDGAGKGATANLLNEWMDPRWIRSHAYLTPSDEELERPEFWRYWRDLPANGRIGIFLRAWYRRPLLDYVFNRLSEAEFDKKLDRIRTFEEELADDGALILKYWLHLGKRVQKQRLRKLEKDPLRSWQVTAEEWEHAKKYDQFIVATEHLITRTSTGAAPWQLVEAVCQRYRGVTVGTSFRDAVARHIEKRRLRKEVASARKNAKAAPKSKPKKREDTASAENPVVLGTGDTTTILSKLDLSKHLEPGPYKLALKEQQGRLNRMQMEAKQRGVSSLLVLEGWDAAGKGGAVRRITSALEAHVYEIIPFAAPTDEERVHHYLWRFWRRLGRAGRVTVFDRSWYGRVLVERVEGFATTDEWIRAYAEINDFEQQLVQHGIVLMKYWVHIDQDEQLARFKSREETPYKRWKLTDEDWRNREKWSQYEEAVHDMIERTSTHIAPWTLVEGNDKRYARVKIIRTFCDALEARLLELADDEQRGKKSA